MSPRFFFEYLYEEPADDLPFFFRVFYPFQGFQKSFFGIDIFQVQMESVLECFKDFLPFILSAERHY